MMTAELKTESIRMSSIVVLYDLQTKFLHNAVEGISNKDANERLDTKANHVAWLVGSIVQERVEMARQLGAENVKSQAAEQLFKDHQGIQDGVTYPPVADFMRDWDNISPILRKAYINADEQKLESRYEMPGMDMSYFDMVAFTTYREANIIGQIALWRRLLGYEGMKYM